LPQKLRAWYETVIPQSPNILTIFQGADIPDIEQVIQFGVPPSLSVWMQRAGRAGRRADLDARALLFVEKSMFESQKKKRRKTDTAESLDLDVDEDELDSDLEEQDNEFDNEREYKKKVEPALREWIETEGCRRDIADRYFNNPPRRLRK
jgi:superfamily II DNA helicase RecQ